MRFLEVPALITEDIEDPNIVDITERYNGIDQWNDLDDRWGLESFRGSYDNFNG